MITEAIRKYGMLEPGDSVLVALSGGADSVCLLHLMRELPQIRVCAAHFDHRLRGAESDRDAAFAENLCGELGVDFLCGSGDVRAEAERTHRSIEETARNMRYAFLQSAAEKLGCKKLATAHNADDNAETVLLNLTRGSGARGLSGIPPVRGNIIRPLILTTRSEIEEYLDNNGIAYVEDSTNESDDYTRNIIRHRVMPVLRQINPAFSSAVLRSSAGLREDEALLEAMAAEFISGEFIDGSVSVQALKALPKPVAVRVLRGICGTSLGMQHCEAVLKLPDIGGLAHADVPFTRVTRDGDRLYFNADVRRLGTYTLPQSGTLAIPEAGMTLKMALIPNCTEVFKSVNKFDINYAAICGIMTLTSRFEGDKVRFSYRGCTKSLKELFREKKLTHFERELVPVIRDGAGIVAVYGFGVAERCEAKTGDTVLRIEIQNKNNN